jgi:hypothetical protein
MQACSQSNHRMAACSPLDCAVLDLERALHCKAVVEPDGMIRLELPTGKPNWRMPPPLPPSEVHTANLHTCGHCGNTVLQFVGKLPDHYCALCSHLTCIVQMPATYPVGTRVILCWDDLVMHNLTVCAVNNKWPGSVEAYDVTSAAGDNRFFNVNMNDHRLMSIPAFAKHTSIERQSNVCREVAFWCAVDQHVPTAFAMLLQLYRGHVSTFVFLAAAMAFDGDVVERAEWRRLLGALQAKIASSETMVQVRFPVQSAQIPLLRVLTPRARADIIRGTADRHATMKKLVLINTLLYDATPCA